MLIYYRFWTLFFFFHFIHSALVAKCNETASIPQNPEHWIKNEEKPRTSAMDNYNNFVVAVVVVVVPHYFIQYQYIQHRFLFNRVVWWNLIKIQNIDFTLFQPHFMDTFSFILCVRTPIHAHRRGLEIAIDVYRNAKTETENTAQLKSKRGKRNCICVFSFSSLSLSLSAKHHQNRCTALFATN